MNLEEIYIKPERSFFFDTYALFEITFGNPNYANYSDVEVTTTKLNLFELYHGYLKSDQEDLGRIFLEKYYPFVVDFDEEVIKAAAKMKKEFAKRSLSMADCIGYCMAKSLGVKFLTGDKEFENLDNVEFVK